MEKICPGKEGYPPRRFNLSERLHEKNVDPLPEPKADNSALPYSDCVALTDLTRLGEQKCLYGKALHLGTLENKYNEGPNEPSLKS